MRLNPIKVRRLPTFLRLPRFLEQWRWFTIGRCAYCGRWGWVFRDDRLHEECWLDLK